jgi:hypothetical protein
MKQTFFLLILAVAGGCISPKTDRRHLMSDIEFQNLLNAADERARITGDSRPYPEGWVGLPRNSDPGIVESIRIGQTKSEVVEIMGLKGWNLKSRTRKEFLSSLRATYLISSSRTNPASLEGIERTVAASGAFSEWRYQGFPSTANWIVVFFSPSPETLGGEPRVVARGVFDLGCF